METKQLIEELTDCIKENDTRGAYILGMAARALRAQYIEAIDFQTKELRRSAALNREGVREACEHYLELTEMKEKIEKFIKAMSEIHHHYGLYSQDKELLKDIK